MAEIDSYQSPKLEKYVTYLWKFSFLRKKVSEYGPGPIDKPNPINWSSPRSTDRSR
jgi:hypothetical protein